MVNTEVFRWLDNLWGPHTIDRFANSHNKQTERYNSRFWDVGSEAIDTFTVTGCGHPESVRKERSLCLLVAT